MKRLERQDRWLERLVERKLHSALVDGYSAGSDGHSWNRDAMRDRLRSRYAESLRREVDERLVAALEDLNSAGDVIRRREVGSEDMVAAEALRDDAIDRWNSCWAQLTDSGNTVGPALRLSLSLRSFPSIDLTNARISSGNHLGADLAGAKLSGADFTDRDQGFSLSGSRLEKADLSHALLDGGDLSDAQLSGADLTGASLRGCDLRRADLRDTVLADVDFTDAKLHEARLDGATVVGTRGLMVDENSIRGTAFRTRSGVSWIALRIGLAAARWANERIAPRSDEAEMLRRDWPRPDPWSKLRRKYSSANLALAMLLLAAVVVPRLGEVLFLDTVGQVQQQVVEAIEDSTPIEADLESLGDRRSRVWRILLGLEGDRLPPVILAVTLLIYNLVRASVTVSVTRLREAEERSSTTPARVDYAWLLPIDRSLVVLAAISALTASVEAANWLTKEIVLLR